ncbi:MAG: trypsin-like peptidase domain-containing protein [Candidatus Dormiibacterota bacterium]
MSSDMQDNLPFDPPPPPPPAEAPGALYGHWSPDPWWGPPPWPPASPARGRSKFMQRTLIAGLALVCIGAGGGTAWALTSATIAHQTIATIPNGPSGTGRAPNSTGGPLPSSGGTASAAAIARVDAATVDINSNTASGDGQVAGTGMIITSSGEVLTNNHVIDNTVNITAQIDGAGRVYKVTVIGYDATDDVALVQLVGASNLPTVPLGNSNNVGVGDRLTVIGNALGKGGTPAVVTGVVSQLDQQITASDESGDTENLTGMLQVEAQIEPGDSGGPEINASGQVVGITTAGSQSNVPSGQEQGARTGFAIPINKAMSIVAEIRTGSGPHIHIGNAALLGVSIAQPNATQTLPGAYVHAVTPGTPAAATGIAANDRIVKIDNTTITSSADLHNVMQEHVSGDTITLTWVDPAGNSHSGSLTLGLAAWPD